MTSPSFAENDGGKFVLMLYLLTVFLASLIGDTLIIVASTRSGAIKLNKFIVAIMQHIAACDILLSITFVLPTIVSLSTNHLIFGFESVLITLLSKSAKTQVDTA